MEDYLTEILADLDDRIKDIKAIGDVNEDLVKIAVTNLTSIKDELDLTQGNLGLKAKIDRQLKTYKMVSRIPELATKFPVIREQIVVLMVGALEVFLSDIYKSIANHNPEYFIWSEKEKIAFDPLLLSGGFTMGDAIIGHMKNSGVSFQDLKSTIDSFEKYCKIKIDLEDNVRDTLIIAAAARHIIVHNRSTIDLSFLKQIRSTRHATSGLYINRNKIEIDDNFITEISESVSSFCSDIVTHLYQRDDS